MGKSVRVGRDLAIDLGTANTLVAVRGKGVIVDEPSVVAVNHRTNEVLAVGANAKKMIGRTPKHIIATRPLRDGVITDFDVAERMLEHFITTARAKARGFGKPRVVVCVPSGITGVEQRAVEEATLAAGAKKAYIIEEPMAAAIGSGMPVSEPFGSMVVDIGGGTTEVAVISLGGIVTSASVRVGGDELDAAISKYVRDTHRVAVGDRTAEQLKISLASAIAEDRSASVNIRGRDLVDGVPKTVEVTAGQVYEAISGPLGRIISAVRDTLDKTPPELAADVLDKGIVLAGGGALLDGLPERLRVETGLPVHVAEDPLRAIVMGAARCLDEVDLLEGVARASR